MLGFFSRTACVCSVQTRFLHVQSADRLIPCHTIVFAARLVYHAVDTIAHGGSGRSCRNRAKATDRSWSSTSSCETIGSRWTKSEIRSESFAMETSLGLVPRSTVDVRSSAERSSGMMNIYIEQTFVCEGSSVLFTSGNGRIARAPRIRRQLERIACARKLNRLFDSQTEFYWAFTRRERARPRQRGNGSRAVPSPETPILRKAIISRGPLFYQAGRYNYY